MLRICRIMKHRLASFSALIAVLMVIPWQEATGQISLHGGRGLLRVQDGEVAEQGDLYVSLFGSSFMKKSADGSGLNKDYHLTLNATYGIGRYFELSGRLVPYQDDQRHIWGPIGDTEIGLKIKVPLGLQRAFHLGIRNYFIIPTGVNHNVEYEPFTANNVGWSPGLAASIDMQAAFLIPAKLYVNGGYIDRNVLDDFFNSDMDQFYLGLGVKLMVKNTVLFWEYYTEQFANRPDKVSFGENFQVSSQGLVFLGPYNLIFTVAGDISLANPSATTFYYPKELADWKIWFGLSKYIPLKSMFREMAERKRQEKELMEELRKQQAIKEERTQAEEELRKMQESLKNNKKNGENQ